MADYRDHYQEIRAAGADVVAISVDRPEQSERLRRELGLPFTILSDADRRVVKSWHIFNSREHGGIAKPSVFIVNTGLDALFHSVDGIRRRTPASEIARILRTRSFESGAERHGYTPRFSDFKLAFRNMFFG